MESDNLIFDASPSDCASIAAVYNQGIRSHMATFETELRSVDQIERWLAGDAAIIKTAFRDDVFAGFAAIFKYRDRTCYSGVAEFSVYVDERHQGHGVGQCLIEGLIAEAARRGYWKLLSRVFPENTACRRMLQRTGFREVGVYERHARLCGAWRDVVIVERLLS